MTDNEILSLQTVDTVCKNVCDSLNDFVAQDARIERFGDLFNWENQLQVEYHTILQDVLKKQLVIQFENLDLASQHRILMKRRECIDEIINQVVRQA